MSKETLKTSHDAMQTLHGNVKVSRLMEVLRKCFVPISEDTIIHRGGLQCRKRQLHHCLSCKGTIRREESVHQSSPRREPYDRQPWHRESTPKDCVLHR